MPAPPLRTPDGRYLIVRGRLWRTSNPNLEDATRQHWVNALMAARRQVRATNDDLEGRRMARAAVDEAKRALGERGPVWWTDGAPDENRRMAKNSSYATWWAAHGDIP